MPWFYAGFGTFSPKSEIFAFFRAFPISFNVAAMFSDRDKMKFTKNSTTVLNNASLLSLFRGNDLLHCFRYI